jgi:hypothetical protein
MPRLRRRRRPSALHATAPHARAPHATAAVLLATALLTAAGGTGAAVTATAAPAAASIAPAPGTIVSSAATTIDALGLPLKVTAWDLTYASTDTSGSAVDDVATVLLPNVAAPTSPRPLVSYQVAEDSLATSCDPSSEMAVGDEAEEPLILAALEQGWAVVVPDYEGPDSEWTAGVQAGHAVLDGIKAAESFSPLGLDGAATPVGLWGYSGGGQASAWASELAPSYAPNVNIVGVAEGGVPPNVADVANKINGGPFSGLYFGAAIGLARAYSNVININALLNPIGQAKFAGLQSACVEELAGEGAFQSIEWYTVNGANPLSMANIQQVVADDQLGQGIPRAPIYLYMSANDELIPVADDDALVAKYCSEGVTVDYVKDELSDHISLAVTGAGSAIDYLQARFAGQPAPSTCATGPSTTLSTLASTQALITMLTALTGLTGFL